MAVVPIRNVRRALKSPPPVMAPDAAEGFRTRIKAVELEAERLQQEALYELAQSGRLGQPCASHVQAAQDSVSAYQGVIGPFPPGPLETVLSAFAKFEAVTRNRERTNEHQDHRARLIVGISGASGTIYGIRMLEMLKKTDIETHLVMSKSAEMTLVYETNYKPKDVKALASVMHPAADIGASISSGSFPTMGMIDRALLDPHHERDRDAA